MKWVTTKHGSKFVLLLILINSFTNSLLIVYSFTNNFNSYTINFKSEVVDIFAPKRFDSTAANFEKKFKKIDKGMILKVIERKNKDNKS